MKRCFCLITIVLFILTSNAQYLSITDLTNICGKSTYEQAATILTQKGWAFYESKTGRWFDGSTYRCTIWSHSRNEWDGEKAQAWFYLYCYDNKICAINYQMFNDNHFAKMDAQIGSAGFKFIKTEYKDNNPVMNYSSSQFVMTVKNSTDDVANYGNRYTFNLIKKGSQADTENGKKIETYWGRKIEYTLVDGEKHGHQKVYYSNGKIKTITTYTHGNETGPYKEYDEEGRLIADGQVKNGEFTGKVKEYENGKLVRDGVIGVNGFTGWQKFYEDGILIGEINIKNGEPHGECKSYYTNGKIKERFTAVQGEKNGPAKYWDEDGRLIFEGTLSPSTNDGYDELYEDMFNEELEYVATGHVWQYDDDGNVESEWYLKEGKKSGKSKSFEKGKLKSEQTYVDGEANGFYKSYYDNGQIQYDLILKNDKPEGQYKEYLENGTLIADGTMHEWKFSGMRKIYNEYDSTITAIYNFKEDLFHGHIVIFDKNGSIKKEGDFTEGTGQLITKDSLGRILCIEPYINNNQENGNEIHYTYNVNNRIEGITITEYKNGIETGNAQIISRDTMVEVSENGNLITLYVTKDSLFTENYKLKTWTKTHTIHLQNGERNGREWIRIPVDDGFDYVECTYSNDVLHGAYRVFHNSTDNFGTAKLSYSFSYSNGMPHGKYTHYGSDSTYVSKIFDHGEITYCMIPFNTDAIPDASFVPYQIEFERLENKNHWKRTFYYRDSIVEQTLHFFMEYPCPIVSLTTPPDYRYDTYTPEIFYFPLSDGICNESVYPDGAYHCTYKNGTKDIKGQYYKLNKIGEWAITYPKQSIKQVITYNRYSVQETEIFYTMEGQLYSGAFIEDFPDSYMVCPIKKGIRHGTAKIYSTATRQVIGKKKY